MTADTWRITSGAGCAASALRRLRPEVEIQGAPGRQVAAMTALYDNDPLSVQLMARVDAAMCQAKEGGRHWYWVYSAKMDS